MQHRNVYTEDNTENIKIQRRIRQGFYLAKLFNLALEDMFSI